MKILVAPLDWGLGHATRCIPIIRELRGRGSEVVIAGSGASLALLQEEFPTLKSYSLPGYQPRYPTNRAMVWAMAAQLPRFLTTIRAEHRVVSQIVEAENVSAIISDNRYGCRSDKVPSVFIAHQLHIQMPRRMAWISGAVSMINRSYINRFDACWIPDRKGERSLAGALAAPGAKLDVPVHYLGVLSRFKASEPAPAIDRDVIFVLSGPEPQRSALEKIIAPQLEASGLRYLVVRGLPAEKKMRAGSRMVNFLPAEALQAEIERSEVVIARSGYSTVMDMHALGKKVIFIPTPGQTEQEYLGRRLRDLGIAVTVAQDSFQLATALAELRRVRGFTSQEVNAHLQPAVDDLLTAIQRYKR